MKTSRNFVFGAALGAVLVAPTLVCGFAPVTASSDNSLAAFADARSKIEARVSASVQVLAVNVADWVAREAAKL